LVPVRQLTISAHSPIGQAEARRTTQANEDG